MGLTYEQYAGYTVAELLWMLEGYQVRWEEQWKHTRYLQAVLMNINSTGKRYRPSEVLPLPSETRAQNEIIEVGGKEMTYGEWMQGLKLKAEAKSNGAGVSS